MKQQAVMNRRAFLRGSSLILGAGMLRGSGGLEAVAADKSTAAPALRVGLLTDVHYADRDARINRFYRESRAKLQECIDRFNQLQPDFIVELGDFIDAANNVEDEIEHLKTVEAEFSRFRGRRVYVLGNHCVSTLTKEEFLDHSGARETFYSFDQGPVHFIVLDACYRADGVSYGRKNFQWTDTEIPPAEQDWLRWDLRKTDKPAVVFVHQRLDVENHYGVKSAPLVRRILEESGKILAVFQGHSHKNEHREISGIHYCTLRAMVEGSGKENSGYGLLNIFGDGSMHLEGFRQQVEQRFQA